MKLVSERRTPRSTTSRWAARSRVALLFVSGVVAAVPGIAAGQEAAPPPIAPAPALAPTPAPLLAPTPAPLFGDRTYRSPGLAVALSLQPLPIDFGNLYAENLGWGIAYTAIETSLLAPMMWMTGQHMNHGTSTDRSWSRMETGAMMGFISGYVVVKVISGVHAGYAARSFNTGYSPRAMATVAPAPGGAFFVWSGSL
jgi:hypothetical protein